ncbi:MAG: nitrite/sulfite reductase [Alphaproteobacteria bacterium]|nr:MAG: nitrite/sulfite reductase [Alphaproteobacteria bacterium]
MYAYDQYDHALVNARVGEFRDQVNRRLSGELTEEEFRPLRLMNGLYLQLHAYMLRVAIPYGTLSANQMRRLAHIARTYDKGYGHFTTRQNVQFNWPKLVDTPDILQELADVEMHAIQTSGNCIRNVTTDQFAGAAGDEVADPRPYAELLRQWSTFHPEFSFLPRKFKIAITAAKEDRAAVKWHDIGLILKQNDAGETGFEVIVGGGMGRTPVIGKTIRDFLPEADLLSYMEAILRVYNEQGRRDNKYKARIKILVEDLGAEEYARQTEAEWQAIRNNPIDVPAEEAARIRAFFAPPRLEVLSDDVAEVDDLARQNFLFAAWVRNNTGKHKVPGHVHVTISLKPHGGIPGDATDAQMDLVADLADQYSQGEIRVSHAQNLILPHVAKRDLPALWKTLDAAGLGAANQGLLTDIIACPGLDYCALANARSIPIAQAITSRFDDMKRLMDIGPLKIKISGCINACGHHHAGHIGILGVDRRGEENYQLLLGGSGAEDASKAAILGPGFGEEGIVDAVEKVVAVYLGEREDGEEFLATYRRLGPAPFKEAVYGAR